MTQAQQRLSLISFDPSKDAAEIERLEDRSLNLRLRQQRIHSEMYRLPLAPKVEAVALLAEIISHSPARPLVVLAREFQLHAAQREAVAQFALLSTQVLIVLIATEKKIWPECTFEAQWLSIPGDDADQIQALAKTLLTSRLF